MCVCMCGCVHYWQAPAGALAGAEAVFNLVISHINSEVLATAGREYCPPLPLLHARPDTHLWGTLIFMNEFCCAMRGSVLVATIC